MKYSNILLIFALLVSTPLLARNNNNNNNNTTTNVCNVADIAISAGGTTISCAGPLSGNDSFNNDSWLSGLDVWTNDGVLTNTNGGSTTDNWMRLAKYDPDSSLDDTGTFGGQTSAQMTFTNCQERNRNGSFSNVNCNGSDAWNKANFTYTLPTLNNFAFDQIVFIIKAAGYYSLYQVDVFASATELMGTIMTLDKHAISHLSMWVREGTPLPPDSVSAPGAILLLMLSAAFVIRRRTHHSA